MIEYFYQRSDSFIIFHQLLLIANYFQFTDEVGNREMQTFIMNFLQDINLERKLLYTKNDEDEEYEYDDYEISKFI